MSMLNVMVSVGKNFAIRADWAWDAAYTVPGHGGGSEMKGYMQSARENAARKSQGDKE